MRNWMETKMPRRVLSLGLSVVMVLSLLPMPSFAAEGDGLCEHHTEHTADCGYVEAVEGQDCTHVCGDECYTVTTACTHIHGAECYSDGVLPAEGEDKTADACTHTCTEESGCVTKTPACVHTAHDETCGYVEAVEGQPCAYHCEICGQEASQNLPEPCVHGNAPDTCPVCPVQALIDALPEEVTAETEQTVRSALSAVDTAKSALTVSDQALLNLTRYTALQEKLASMELPLPAGDKVVTAWQWIDEEEMLDEETGGLALPGASEETPAYFVDVVSLLPYEIIATADGAEETLSVDWVCENYPESGAYAGEYTFTAKLPQGYVLGEGVNALTVNVLLGGGSNYSVNSIPYLTWNDTQRMLVSATCDNATVLTDSDTEWNTGWYVAQGNVTIGDRVTVSGDVHLILEDGCDLIVTGGIRVEGSNALTIYAQSTAEDTMGKLTTQNVDYKDAAIGGNMDEDGGTITINGGIVQAESSGGAAIGGGRSDDIGGSGGAITINGGVVKAESDGGAAIGGGFGEGVGGSGGAITINGGVVQAESTNGAAIGGGYGGAVGGSGGAITINGGVVQAESTNGAGIGGGYGNGESGGSGSFSTGTSGNAVIFASSIADQSGKTNNAWSGVIFEGGKLDSDTQILMGRTGKVYGSPTLSLGLPIPEKQSLTLDMDGKSLTFAQGTGITRNSNSTLKLSGPGSFPGGLSVTGGTLGDLLAEGWAYQHNGSWVYDTTADSLSGTVSLAQVPLTITTQPAGDTITYGGTASLSVTAEPVTSGSTVSYQWYQDGEDLPGQTQSTLSLSGLNAGTYQIYCAVTCGGFTVNSQTATVTVNKAQGSVAINGGPGKTYDGQSVSMDGKYTITGTGTVEYKLEDADDNTYTTTAPKDAGKYTVRVTAEDANHTAASATKDFTISQADLTVKANDKTITYGDAPANSGVTYSGFVNNEDASVLGGTLAYTYSYSQYGDVGSSYTITPSGLTSDNYNITFDDGALTVQQKEIVISWGNTQFTYDGSAHKPTATPTGMVNGDTITLTVSGEQTNAGTGYTATVDAIQGTKAGNYVLPQSVTTTFSIAKKEVTITGTTVEATKVYDGSTTAQITSDGTLSDNYDGGNLTIARGSAAYDTKNVGESKTVTFSGFSLGGSAADNYVLTAQPASVTANITAKPVTLTVTVKDKPFDDTTTAEIDTVTLNGIVEGDSVQVVNGTPSFTRKTSGENIPISFTEFTLEGTHAGNYQLTQPTGVTGRILPTGNYLNLTGNTDFAKQTEVWVDGVAYSIQTEDGRYVNLPETGDLLTVYTYQQGSAHEKYPTGMAVYRIVRSNGGATVEEISELNDLLQYSGCSIRITGKQGIRMITSLTKGNKSALTGAGLAGYTLEEYGTVVQWADTLGDQSLTLATGKSNYAYKKGVSDPVFANVGDLTQYTNVLVWDSLTDAQLGKDIVMRPYILLKDGSGNTVTLYGGCVSRSIGYIAYQNRAVFNPGTAAYKYVWDIIHAVYGNQYDSEYKG